MVRRIPTQGFGERGPTPAGAGRIAGGPIVGDLYQRQLDRFVVESPEALAFARQSLPGYPLSRIGPNVSLMELRTELAENRVVEQAASWPVKLASGAIVGSLAMTPLVACGLVYQRDILGISLAVVVAATVTGSVAAVASAKSLAVGAVSTGLALIASGIAFFVFPVPGAAALVLVCIVLFGLVDDEGFPFLLYALGATILYFYLVGTGVRGDLRRVESFLDDPTSRESFFQAHPGEFVRFLKESVSQCFRDKQAEVRRMMDRLEAEMGEIRNRAAAEIRGIEDSAVSNLKKEGLKETVWGVESRALQERVEAHERQKKVSEAIDQFMDEVNRMRAAVENEMSGDVYQRVAQFERYVEEKAPGLVEEADASLREYVIDLHGYLEQLKEAADRLQALMAAEVQVEQLLGSVPRQPPAGVGE